MLCSVRFCSILRHNGKILIGFLIYFWFSFKVLMRFAYIISCIYRIDRSILYARLKKLFKKHKHLIIGFNTFLSLGDKIFLHGDAEASTSSTA